MRFLRSSHTTTILIVHSILFLFFFQLLTDFVAAIYAFGLLGLNLPPEIACVLLLFSPALLLFLRRGLADKGLTLLAAFVLVSRIVEAMLDTRTRMFVSGAGVAAFLIFLPAWLHHQQRDEANRDLGASLGLGVALSILLRALGSGVDLSSVGMFKGIGWALALLAGAFLPGAFSPVDDVSQPGPFPDQPQAARPWRVIGLSLGITASFILLYFAFTSPTVIARWTGASYPLILVLLLVALSGFVVGQVWKPSVFNRIKTFVLLVWNALFVLSLALTLLAHQVRFPSTSEGYPFSPASTPWSNVSLFLMLLLSPIILVDFASFSREIVAEWPSIRLLGGSFALASLFLLVMIFAQVFTTVYDYIPVVGPLFRDRFWVVFLAGGLVLTLPALLLRNTRSDRVEEADRPGTALPVTACMALITIVTIGGTFLNTPRPTTPPASRIAPIRVLTYNIQQGYSLDGQQYLDGPRSQLSVLRKMKPDVIGLQETDTARISGGNIDVVRFFADRLNMYSYYGPSTVAGTFGIALLSRYPIQNPHTYFMYSVGEQTAVITAQVAVGGKTYDIFVTHLGNDGPIVQLNQVMQLVEGKQNVMLMGDFNFRPDTAQYRLTTATLSDAWLLRYPQGNPSQEFDPSGRIDYLYVSPGTQVIASQYLTGSQSDHPAMVTDIAP